MAREDTRRTLDAFGTAVVNLEHAIEEGAPVEEIFEWDRVVADRTREVINLVETLRSRRIR
jgi:hypothetical protein